MKQPFNNVGVAQVQAHVIGLASPELAQEVAALRSDLQAWMIKHFDLHPSQVAQLLQLPTSYRQYLADHVADMFEQRSLISFYKQDNDDDDDDDEDEPRGKDIIIQPVDPRPIPFGGTAPVEFSQLSIWILYRS